MDNNFNAQCSNAASGSTSPTSDEDVLLASSCPKKRAGRKKFKETRHPVYRGVRQRNGNRWVCEVRTPIDNSRIWLGTYPTAEMAARAHDVAALALRGPTACLNFADSACRLPVPASTDARDIQRAAAEAGELFRQPELPFEEASQDDEIGTHETGLTDNNPETGVTDNNPETGLTDNNPETGVTNTNNNNNDNNPSDEVAYMDEEAVFNMPSLIDNMAQGLLLPPPRPSNSWGGEDDGGSDCEVSLWNH